MRQPHDRMANLHTNSFVWFGRTNRFPPLGSVRHGYTGLTKRCTAWKSKSRVFFRVLFVARCFFFFPFPRISLSVPGQCALLAFSLLFFVFCQWLYETIFESCYYFFFLLSNALHFYSCHMCANMSERGQRCNNGNSKTQKKNTKMSAQICCYLRLCIDWQFNQKLSLLLRIYIWINVSMMCARCTRAMVPPTSVPRVCVCVAVSHSLSLFGFGQLILGILCGSGRGHPTTSTNWFAMHTHTCTTPLSYTQFDCITNQMRIFVLVNFPECAFDAVCIVSGWLSFHSFSISFFVRRWRAAAASLKRFDATLWCGRRQCIDRDIGDKWVRWRRLCAPWLLKQMRNWFTRMKIENENEKLIKRTFNMVLRRMCRRWKGV